MRGISVFRLPKAEQVYTFKEDKTGELHHFAVDQMNAYIRAALKPELIVIHPDMLKHLVNRGGWEPDHLANMSDAALEAPCTLIDYGDGTHVLADGVHRVLKHAQKGHDTFPAYVVPERIWRRFLIEDVPREIVDWDDFLVNGDRHEGLSPKLRKRVALLK